MTTAVHRIATVRTAVDLALVSILESYVRNRDEGNVYVWSYSTATQSTAAPVLILKQLPAPWCNS